MDMYLIFFLFEDNSMIKLLIDYRFGKWLCKWLLDLLKLLLVMGKRVWGGKSVGLMGGGGDGNFKFIFIFSDWVVFRFGLGGL